MESVNEIPICFSGECFELMIIQITENISLSELKSTLLEAILHLCWNIKLLPKTTKKIKCISNFLGMLNWMLQILHHYCRKQHTKKKAHKLSNKMLWLSAFLSANCISCFLPYSMVEFSGSWTQHFAEILQIFNVTSDFLKTTFFKSSQNITTCV